MSTATADGTQIDSTGAPATPPAVPATAPNLSEWRKSDGSINHAAFAALPEDIRHVGETLGKYKTDVDMFRGIANLQTLGGKKGLIPLAADAPPEVRAERKSLMDSINGVPKEAKDYGIKKPDGIPDAYWNPKLVDGYVAWAHKHSVSPAAAKEMVEVQLATVKDQLAQQAQYETDFFAKQQQAFDAAIRTEGVSADKAASLVERGAIKLGMDIKDPGVQTLLKNSNVRLMALRHAVATGEDSFVGGDAPRGSEGDPERLASDAVHNKANPLYEPLHNTSHPQHKMAAQKVDGWWRLAGELSARRNKS